MRRTGGNAGARETDDLDGAKRVRGEACFENVSLTRRALGSWVGVRFPAAGFRTSASAVTHPNLKRPLPDGRFPNPWWVIPTPTGRTQLREVGGAVKAIYLNARSSSNEAGRASPVFIQGARACDLFPQAVSRLPQLHQLEW